MTPKAPKTLREALVLTQATRWRRAKDEERSSRQVEDLIELFGNLKVSACGPWIARELARLRPEWSPATVNRYVAALSAVLRTAEEYGGPKAPRFPRGREAGGRIRVLTEDERRHFLSLGGHLAEFMLYTGARRSELERLTRYSDFNGSEVVFRGTKSGRDRVLPWSGPPLQWGRGCFPEWWRLLWEGVPNPPTPHVIRHTCATDMIRAGITLPVVRDWLGHSSINTTMRYVHVDQSDLEKAAETMRERIGL